LATRTGLKNKINRRKEDEESNTKKENSELKLKIKFNLIKRGPFCPDAFFSASPRPLLHLCMIL
jgi:hypothetical protein